MKGSHPVLNARTYLYVRYGKGMIKERPGDVIKFWLGDFAENVEAIIEDVKYSFRDDEKTNLNR